MGIVWSARAAAGVGLITVAMGRAKHGWPALIVATVMIGGM